MAPMHLYCAPDVPFQLKISKGVGKGKVFTFADNEARIGRTPENDIIVKDGGVSREHARIYAQGKKVLVEDLGSANGTRLNGAVIAGPSALSDGDSVTIGDVTFVFEQDDAVEYKGQDRTAIVASVDSEAEEDDGDAAPVEQEGGANGARAGMTRRVSREELKASPARGRRSLVKSSPSRTAVVADDRGSRGPSIARRHPTETAVEKARRRRDAEGSLVGQAMFALGELPRSARIGVGVVAALGVLAVFGGVLYWVRGERTASRGPEPAALGVGRVEDSFGFGQGVDWERQDMKIFTFALNVAGKAVAVLRYQAANVSQDEVVITVNGVEQGQVPPDTLDTEAREVELVLRPSSLKQHASNSLMFDNTRNPPGKDSWKIWNIGLEIVPIPEVAPEELLRLAGTDATKAKEYYDLRDVGPDNLFKAWKSYRNAWLTLEGLDVKPELYDYVRAQMRLVAPELDRKCRLMMLEAQRAIELKKYKRARQVLDDVPRSFPTRDHRCQTLAREKIQEYDL